jgi:hypothetical protein
METLIVYRPLGVVIIIILMVYTGIIQEDGHQICIVNIVEMI